MDKELIIFATPPNASQYYANFMDGIFSFHIGYANKTLKSDDVSILARQCGDRKGQWDAQVLALSLRSQ